MLHDGYATVRCAYGDNGNIAGMAYCGVDGAPIENENGYAKRVVEYDGAGETVAERKIGE